MAIYDIGQRMQLEEWDTQLCEVIAVDERWTHVRFEDGTVDRFLTKVLEPHRLKRRYAKRSA